MLEINVIYLNRFDKYFVINTVSQSFCLFRTCMDNAQELLEGIVCDNMQDVKSI